MTAEPSSLDEANSYFLIGLNATANPYSVWGFNSCTILSDLTSKTVNPNLSPQKAIYLSSFALVKFIDALSLNE